MNPGWSVEMISSIPSLRIGITIWSEHMSPGTIPWLFRRHDITTYRYNYKFPPNSGADPGLMKGGGSDEISGNLPIYIFQNLTCQKLVLGHPLPECANIKLSLYQRFIHLGMWSAIAIQLSWKWLNISKCYYKCTSVLSNIALRLMWCIIYLW